MSNVKINKNGNLEVERAGGFRSQSCPSIDGAACGDWCPMFEEPKHYKDKDIQGETLRICQTYFVCSGKIIDERFKKETETGVEMISAIRARQKDKYSTEHDKNHSEDEFRHVVINLLSGWLDAWGIAKKHPNQIDQLAHAGAIIAALIDKRKSEGKS